MDVPNVCNVFTKVWSVLWKSCFFTALSGSTATFSDVHKYLVRSTNAPSIADSPVAKDMLSLAKEKICILCPAIDVKPRKIKLPWKKDVNGQA